MSNIHLFLPWVTCMGMIERENQILELKLLLVKVNMETCLWLLLIFIPFPYASYPQTPLLPMLRSALPNQLPDPQATDGLPRDFFDVETQGSSGDILDP